ncbi:Hypothetical protein GbCGDNIH8_8716 [Granulibacter bethesdensis]|nr:Hypothetical protein GbCGDNIH8_8716 [Granulibacter bethesdensis]
MAGASIYSRCFYGGCDDSPLNAGRAAGQAGIHLYHSADAVFLHADRASHLHRPTFQRVLDRAGGRHAVCRDRKNDRRCHDGPYRRRVVALWSGPWGVAPDQRADGGHRRQHAAHGPSDRR